MQQVQQIGSIVINSTHAERTAYARASMGSPSDSALLKAFSKNYIDMHDITPKMIRQNSPAAIATAQGHLRLHKKGLNSTKLREHRQTKIHHDSNAHLQPTHSPQATSPLVNSLSLASQETIISWYQHTKTISTCKPYL